MNIKDLVITGVVKILKSISIEKLIVKSINGASEEEISYLMGLTSNVQEQLTSLQTKLQDAKSEQSNFKATIATAICSVDNTITNLTEDSTLEEFKTGIEGIETGIDTSDATATEDHILSGYTAYASGNKLTGTMANHGTQTVTSNVVVHLGNIATSNAEDMLCAGGYYEGITVKGVDIQLSDYTKATATASQILSGKTAWVNGIRVTGTMPDNGVVDSSFGGFSTGFPNMAIRESEFPQLAVSTKNVARLCMCPPTGYYPGGGGAYIGSTLDKVASVIGLTADKLVAGNIICGISGTATSDANATAANILYGQTAYVNGNKLTGTMPDRTSNTGTVGLAWQGNAETCNPDSNALLEITPSQLRIPIPKGYYGSENYSNWNCSGIVVQDFQSKLGIIPNKIATGNTICGIVGNANSIVEWDGMFSFSLDGYKILSTTFVSNIASTFSKCSTIVVRTDIYIICKIRDGAHNNTYFETNIVDGDYAGICLGFKIGSTVELKGGGGISPITTIRISGDEISICIDTKRIVDMFRDTLVDATGNFRLYSSIGFSSKPDSMVAIYGW